MTGIILILIILAAIALWCIATINNFKKKEIRVSEALSGVEIALSKRFEMLKKLLDTAKGYAAHETELFTEVIELRHGMNAAELGAAEERMDLMSGKIAALAENYPTLRSDSVFVELQRGIRDAEEHLQAARRLYNSNVAAYNTAISIFPAKLLTGSRKPLAFFAASDAQKSDVNMSF